MRIGVLGMLLVDGAAPNLREATMLAALALDPGRQVTAAALADAYWGETPPVTWPKQVQGAISRLRSLLGPSSITTGNGGYTLDVPSDRARQRCVRRVDRRGASPARLARQFRRRAASSAVPWRCGAGARSRSCPSGDPAQAVISRLEDLRLTAEEDLATAMLEAGDHRGAVTLAERMVAESPYREERWALLALAAYRSGRQADALAALRAARARLREDLGIEPG